MYKNLFRSFLLGAIFSLIPASAISQARYDFSRLKMENLGRGVVAVRESPEKVNISWRYLTQDPESQAFDIYRDGKKINKAPITESTYFSDEYKGSSAATYEVRPTKGNLSGSFTLPANAPLCFLNIPLDRPQLGVYIWGKAYFYNANDASI